MIAARKGASILLGGNSLNYANCPLFPDIPGGIKRWMNFFMGQHSAKVLSSLFLMAVLVAVVVNAVIPAGYMPQNKRGFVELVICSGMGEKTVLVDAGDVPAGDHQDKTDTANFCAYQFLASAKIPVVPQIIILPVFHFETLAKTMFSGTFLPRIYSASITARGPPSV